MTTHTFTNALASSTRTLDERGACSWTGLSLDVRGDPFIDCSCSVITHKIRACNKLALCIVKIDCVSTVRVPTMYCNQRC